MRGDLVNNLFLVIEQLISVTQITFSRASLASKLRQLNLLQMDSRYLNRSLKRFQKGNLVETFNKNQQIYYRLTDKGFIRLINYRFKNQVLSKAQKWDGFWRVIIFDIPEHKKIAREALRRKLKYFNFFPLQKSVFVFPFKCEREIQALADFFQINNFLEIVLARSLGSKENEIRKFFKLPSN